MEDFVLTRTKERFPEFEISNIKVTISPDAKLPVGVSYHLLVKGYAQRTGKRLFLRPGFFTAGRRAFFTEANRSNDVYFDYPWSEEDTVDVRLPEGFQLDHPERPAPFEIKPVVKYGVNISIENPGNTLLYRRSFMFGGESIPIFAPKNYAVLKTVFDRVHSDDDHMITLKLAETTPNATHP